MTSYRDLSLGRITLGAVLLSALPLGANRPVWWLILAVVVLALFVAQISKDLLSKYDRMTRLALIPLSLALFVVIWAIAQVSVPVGAPLQHPIWAYAGVELGFISADPINGLHHVIKMTTYIMVFWIAVRSARETSFATWSLGAIAIFASALSAFGLIALLADANPILGERATNSVSASFVNRNNYATFAAIGLLANLTVYAQLKPETSIGGARNLRDFLEGFFSSGWIFASGILICLAGILMSESRAGLGAAVLGVVVYTVTSRERGAVRSYATLFGVGLVGFALVAFSSGTVSRLFTSTGEEARFLIYPLIVDGISDRPWVGHGVGSFQDAFREYVSVELSSREINLAHSSYLENVFELGIPAASVFYLALVIILIALALGLRRRKRNKHFSSFAFSVALAVTFHAAFDFSLQIPAIAALFAFVLGVGWAQSFSSNDRHDPSVG